MTLSLTAVIKVYNIVGSLLKESPMKVISENELSAAMNEIKYLNSESNLRDGLNRALTHLESAYAHYKPSTLNFLEKDRALWSKRSYKNELCILISIIHYLLGNINRAKIWLSEELSEFGDIALPKGVHELLGVSQTEDYFNLIFGDNGKTYECKSNRVYYNRDHAFDDDACNPYSTWGNWDF